MLVGNEDQDQGVVAPELTEKQRQEAEDRMSVSANVVHEAIRHDGEEELNRPVSALAWSGFAAGLSMGFSFVAQGLNHAQVIAGMQGKKRESRLSEVMWPGTVAQEDRSITRSTIA